MKTRIRDHRGFTLIELMVVIVLIGIMTAMIIPEMRGTMEDAVLRSTGRKLVSVFGLAYSRAITLNQLHRVRLDSKTGRYLVETTRTQEEGGGGFAPARDFPESQGELDTRISVEVRRPDEEPSAPSDQEGPRRFEDDSKAPGGEIISFYADGTADAREIILRDREGFRLALRINPTTAQVYIVRLERE